MSMERSDVFCTNCEGRFIAELDLSLNGNHEITCPLCGHVHYRVVRDGVVTEDRWRSSAGPTFVVNTSTVFQVTTNANITTATTPILMASWLNTSSLNLG